NATDHQLEEIDEPGIEEAEEGRVLTRVHRYRERNRKLVDARKRQAMKSHGRLACEACGFEFARVYGGSASGIIECHHTRPVHTLTERAVTRGGELATLLAKCH